MTEPRNPDTLIRFLDAGHDDPDRQMALRITNFVGGMNVRQAVAVYALALQMSFRGIDDGTQRAILRAISESCLKTWANNRGEPEPDPCHHCSGLGTIGGNLDAETCPFCQGTGSA